MSLLAGEPTLQDPADDGFSLYPCSDSAVSLFPATKFAVSSYDFPIRFDREFANTALDGQRKSPPAIPKSRQSLKIACYFRCLLEPFEPRTRNQPDVDRPNRPCEATRRMG
jgi:hypothetical protein